MEKYKIRIKGFRPLLVNRYPLDEISVKKARKATVFDPVAQAEKALYRDTNGKIFIPAEHLEGAMIKGAAQIKKKGKKTFKDDVAQSVIVMPQQMRFSVPIDPESFEVDVRTGVIPSTRGRVPVARPRWDEWEIECEIQNGADEDINIETMEEIIIEAGKIGIGTFRLKFGKFKLTEIGRIK